MAGVLPKVKTYFFLSMICLLINFAVLFTTFISNPDTETQGFLGEATYTDENILIEDDSAELKDFVFSGGTSFVPFFSLVPLTFVSDELPVEMTTITGIVIAIIGAFQIFLLSIIILNMIPKLVGSGFDV